MLSGSLDEQLIERLMRSEVPVDAFGVGTALDVSADAPALAPGVVLSHAIPDTPFTALLCLPLADTESSFALGAAGAPTPATMRRALATSAATNGNGEYRGSR